MKLDKSVSEKILYIDTSSDVSRVGLFVGRDELKTVEWKGKGDLSENLISKIDSLLKESGETKESLTKIAVLAGPGSYTGLRIGITVANFLAWSLSIPIVEAGIIDQKLILKSEKPYILPEYYADPHITKQRK